MIYKENRFCPGKGYYVDFVTLKNLCRVLKNRKLFVNFRGTIGCNTMTFMSIGYLTPIVRSSNMFKCQYEHNPFKKCKDLKNILDVIASHNHCPLNMDNEASIQNRIIGTTNMLLHVLVERSVNMNIQLLEKIGEETFNITCKELFGNDFKDLTVPEGVDMDIVRKINDRIRRGESIDLSPEEKKQMDKFMQFINQSRPPQHQMEFDEDGFDDGEDWDDELDGLEDLDELI
jgi:hypothetical protein